MVYRHVSDKAFFLLSHKNIFSEFIAIDKEGVQGPFVQRFVSLRCLIVVKMLTVLVQYLIHIFLLKKCEKLLQMQKLLSFYQQNISVYAIFNDQSFNAMLTNNIISFEQLGPDKYMYQ